MTTLFADGVAGRLPAAMEAMFTVLAPRTVGPLTVAPLVRNAAPTGEYLGLAGALERGAAVTEVGEAGSVGRVVVQNPLAQAVLLADGQEIAGAKQDRILNLSVLVPAGARLLIPVSCVERGRWGRRAGSHGFSAAPRSASPGLRRSKAEAMRGGAGAAAATQGRVWDEVGTMSARTGSRSSSQAWAGVVEALGERVTALVAALPAVPGQCGAIVAIGGRVVCLDVVSRVDVFAELWPRLMSGYAADAVGAPPPEGPVRRRGFVQVLKAVSTVPLRAQGSAGMGTDLRGATERLEVTGLVAGGELVQLSAYVR